MFIIIETFPEIENAFILKDENEHNIVFNTRDEALSYAEENAQDPLIVNI